MDKLNGCGRSETCGGMFSTCISDSDWQVCEDHIGDYLFFRGIHTAQVIATLRGDVIPSTKESCINFLKHINELEHG
jgi:hypothetical protein